LPNQQFLSLSFLEISFPLICRNRFFHLSFFLHDPGEEYAPPHSTPPLSSTSPSVGFAVNPKHYLPFVKQKHSSTPPVNTFSHPALVSSNPLQQSPVFLPREGSVPLEAGILALEVAHHSLLLVILRCPAPSSLLLPLWKLSLPPPLTAFQRIILFLP